MREEYFSILYVKLIQSNQNIYKIVMLFFLVVILALYCVFEVHTDLNYSANVLSMHGGNRNWNSTPSTTRNVAPTDSSILERLFSENSATNMSTDNNMSITTVGAEISLFLRKSNCKIAVCSIGNLGNQIWEYMSLFVVWKRYVHSGYTPYIQETMSSNLKVLFPNLSISPSSEDLCNVPRTEIILKHNSLDMYDTWFEVSNDQKCKNVYLDEYSSRYEEILDYGIARIKEEMSFAPRLVTHCQHVLLYYKQFFNLQDKDVTFVGMHYRGTDYVHHLEINYPAYKPKISTYKYYVEAMKYFKEKYENVIFILITIDDVWLDNNIEAIVNNSTVIVNPNGSDRLQDLVLLSQCNHNIINYGTFGATAALLAGGTTFVYDLKLPLDHRGSTLAMGMAKILKDWHSIS